MTRALHICLLVVIVCLLPTLVRAEAKFAGTWETSFGPMYLHEENGSVSGFYHSQGAFCKIEGALAKSRWTFTYQEPQVRGEGHFDLAEDGQSFSGQWRPLGAEGWLPWTGKRIAAPASVGGFPGVWSTSFGRMRLIAGKDGLSGCYAFPYGATITGKLKGNQFTFTYKEPAAHGEGTFELAEDGRSFFGKWRTAGSEAWLDWYGVRIDPVPGRSWLVVVEAHWEHDLAEPEYSFGDMLRTFFARAPRVQMRHRFVNSGADLAKACHEVTYLTEPVLLVVASHGTGAGVTVGGDTVGAGAFAQALAHAPNLRLLHFSSCSIMGDRLPKDLMDSRDAAHRFPISGYTQPVDWAGSAVLEFLYFDMILSRGLPAAKAAEQVRLLVPFAQDKPIPRSIIPPAGFRLLVPPEK